MLVRVPKGGRQRGGSREQKGEGFFGDVGNWFKDRATDVVRNVKPSDVLGLIPGAQVPALLARKVGLGRKRRLKGRRLGGTAGGKRSGLHPIASKGRTKAGMIVQPKGTGFYTMPLSLNGGVMSGGKRGMVR